MGADIYDIRMEINDYLVDKNFEKKQQQPQKFRIKFDDVRINVSAALIEYLLGSEIVSFLDDI